MIPDADSPAIEDGAVLVEGSQVKAVGRYADLARQHAGVAELGSSRHLVLPGFVNSDSHGLIVVRTCSNPSNCNERFAAVSS